MKKKSSLSFREIFMLVALIILVVGVGYYMGFYTPLQNELAEISRQSAEVDSQIAASASRIKQMDAMQTELEEILSRPSDEITEIAAYDNKEVVFNQLNGILQQSLQYSLNFSEPSIQDNGTVRRNVAMNFSCADFASAKAIIRSLSNSPWRCLVSNLSISGAGNVMEGTVQVNATITFFESTKLS